MLYKGEKTKAKNNKLLLFLVVPSLELANKYTQGYVRNDNSLERKERGVKESLVKKRPLASDVSVKRSAQIPEPSTRL